MVRRCVALSLFALVLMGAGKARTPEAVLTDAQRAIDDYEGPTRGIAAAYVELEQLVTADPKNARAWRMMGTILNFRSCPGGLNCDAKMLTSAMENFDKALALEPKMPEAVLGRAWVFKFRRDDWAAEEGAKAALALRPGWANPLYLLGDIAIEQRRYTDAIDAGREIVAAPKANADALSRGHRLLATAYAATDDFDRAEASHRTLIALEPKNAWMKGNYAGFLVHVRRYEDAIKQAKAALALMDYGAARWTLKRAYQLRAEELRTMHDDKGARKYDRLAAEL